MVRVKNYNVVCYSSKIEEVRKIAEFFWSTRTTEKRFKDLNTDLEQQTCMRTLREWLKEASVKDVLWPMVIAHVTADEASMHKLLGEEKILYLERAEKLPRQK